MFESSSKHEKYEVSYQLLILLLAQIPPVAWYLTMMCNIFRQPRRHLYADMR